jgi:hypothetical protein
MSSPSQALTDLGEHAPDVGLVSDIATHQQRASATLLDLGRDRLGRSALAQEFDHARNAGPRPLAFRIKTAVP